MDITALILTGGASSRFGSDKASAILAGKTLIEQIVDSLPKEWPIVIVGPEFANSRHSLHFTREEPIGGGPVSAVGAGLTSLATEFVAVIATDMPFAGQVIQDLAERVILADGVIPLDSEGFRQSLCAIYRVSSLNSALKSLSQLHGNSMRNVIAALSLEDVTLETEYASNLLDIDTLADLKRAQSKEKNVEKWLEEVRKELGVSIEVDTDSILNVARDAAHAVERKAAPMTTFLLGYAVAQGGDITSLVEKISLLAKEWPAAE